MNRAVFRGFVIFILSGLLFSLGLTNQVGQASNLSAPTATPTVPQEPICRFAITTPYNAEGYNLDQLRVGGFLNWKYWRPAFLPQKIVFSHVLRLRDDLYASTLIYVENYVPTRPGSYWIVGNEPDAVYEDQDELLPEVYAERYFAVASRIRQLDPTARLGFGAIIQPTPIRLRYLDRAWNRLVALAGSQQAASDLIDYWTIHSFILNEKKGEWGAGIPSGFESSYADAVPITNFADTYSVALFQNRVRNFRAWMEQKGERNKPLWITEYGSLLPPIDPPGGPNYVNVSDALTGAFMTGTFDFMLNAQDPATGLPTDNNRLVQRWFWYSLNDYRYKFGGTLYDPAKEGYPLTAVGSAWINYVKNIELYSGLQVEGNLTVEPDPAQANSFLAKLSISNSGNMNFTPTAVWFFPDSFAAQSLASQVYQAPGCGELLHITQRIPFPTDGFRRLIAVVDTNQNGIADIGDQRVNVDAPPFATRLQVMPRSRTSLSLSWVDALNESGYRLERTTDGSIWDSIADLPADSTAYVDNSLTCGQSYGYRLVTLAGGKVWGSSNSAFASTDACDPPGLSAVGVSRIRIRLTWSDTLSTESGYYVERSSDGSTDWERIATAPANAQSYSDASLDCGTTRFYRLQPFNAFETWDASTPASASTFACDQLPNVPSGVVAAPHTAHAIRISWNDQDDLTYIERSLDGLDGWVQISSAPPGTTRYIDSGLEYATLYYYRLRAGNPVGLSDYCAVVSARTFSFDYYFPIFGRR